MNEKNFMNAGEVTVNTMDQVSEFEKRSIALLRHVDKLFETKQHVDLPPDIKRLFSDPKTRACIIDFLTVFQHFSLRPLVRHQAECLCVGADENVFSNLLLFSLEGSRNEAKILGSLLVKGQQISNLIQKAKIVADLIDNDLRTHPTKREKNTFYYKYLN